jgi:alpha-1,2-mannosyltransferase
MLMPNNIAAKVSRMSSGGGTQENAVLVPRGSGAVTSPAATSWPYVIATCAAIAAIVYLSVWGRRYGLDLKVYRDSVSFWKSGKNPYLATFTQQRLPFTYPPFALLALSLFAWPSFPIAQWLLWAASIAAATGSVVLVLRDRGVAVTKRLWCEALAWSCVSVIALEPARSGVDYGQIECILMFLVVADLLLVPARYRGVLTGFAAAVKLTPLIFVLAFAVSRDVKSVIRAVASFLAWTALSWSFWPGLSRLYWFHDVSRPARYGPIAKSANQSWYAILHRAPFSADGSELAWLLLSLLTLAVTAFVAWRCLRVSEKGFAIVSIALAGLLVSPISWTHHWIWVLLIPPMLVCRRSPDVPRPVRMLFWGLIVLAIAAPYWWFSHGIPADVLDAVLPLWACAILVVWGAIGLRTGSGGVAAAEVSGRMTTDVDRGDHARATAKSHPPRWSYRLSRGPGSGWLAGN